MRLIDADKFIEWLDIGHLRSPSEKCLNEINVKQMIDNQPTAYDVDKVVKKLKEHNYYSTTVDEVVKIVEGGGLDE
ncbi:MAG: hypothetical protein K0R92_442 [Lachnospiraceae bacterium]|jgi:hypothetical protein|nr:hypothetical protein [Lachnospiraceae bacterium]